jgi:hypothetical protein
LSLGTWETIFSEPVANLSYWTEYFLSWFKLDIRCWYSPNSHSLWTLCRYSSITVELNTWDWMVAPSMRIVHAIYKSLMTGILKKRYSFWVPGLEVSDLTCKFPTLWSFSILIGTLKWMNRQRIVLTELDNNERSAFIAWSPLPKSKKACLAKHPWRKTLRTRLSRQVCLTPKQVTLNVRSF